MLRSEDSVDNDPSSSKRFYPRLRLVINYLKIEQGKVETRNRTAFNACVLD